MRGRAVALLALGLATSAAQAQEPILLRRLATGALTHYRTEMDTWMRTALLASADTTLPTVHVTMFTTGSVVSADSGMLVTAIGIDSSRIEMPGVRAFAPQLMPSGDYLRGLRTVTRSDSLGRTLATRVTEAPPLPGNLPALIRGVQSLALTSIRLTMFTLPQERVLPGDTWTDSLSYTLTADQAVAPSLVAGGGRSVASFRLERVESRGGSQVAVIASTADIKAAAETPGASATLLITATAQFDFDVTAGLLVSARMDFSGPLATRMGIIPTRVHLTQRMQ
jgi:hypothetical protein